LNRVSAERVTENFVQLTALYMLRTLKGITKDNSCEQLLSGKAYIISLGIVGVTKCLENQHYSIVYQMQKRKVQTFLLLYIEPNIEVERS
jgi:hypothetical protein